MCARISYVVFLMERVKLFAGLTSMRAQHARNADTLRGGDFYYTLVVWCCFHTDGACVFVCVHSTVRTVILRVEYSTSILCFGEKGIRAGYEQRSKYTARHAKRFDVIMMKLVVVLMMDIII